MHPTIGNTRDYAARVLAHRRAGDEFTETLLERALAPAGLSAADRGLCHELVFGVVRWQATLDWLIAQKTQGRTQKPGLQDLLRLGLYQIFWLDRIPDHAAVHETVELAKRDGYGAQAGFVNAVLRGFLREAIATKALLTELKTTQPALGWSQPGWLVARWLKQWGDERMRSLLEWNNAPAKLYARVNTLRADAGQLVEQWRDEGVEYDFLTRNWTGENLMFELKSHPPLASLASFRQGKFYIQDPSTLLAVRELDPRPGESILDLCAAPGGKTTFMAQLMNNEGRLVACDLAEERLQLVRENCTRLGVTCVEAVTTPPLPPQSTSFDKVLVDAPCSNTGVLRRRVDLRWRIQPEEISRLRTTQLNLLRQAATLLKPGGVLVYSTCSLEPEENGEVVSEFLSASTGFGLERERALTPFADSVDGAYVARLAKGM
ncbi:MAG: 16S rRNA (cytosine(967)-C(5))-methyltransferase RsmB [Verrucomicrobia subdivision 3 bacterium]|nr:16S rRNA (cytosine(967)-C(5))-methyltransferase RsmB [Limisphaerales bacterium]